MQVVGFFSPLLIKSTPLAPSLELGERVSFVASSRGELHLLISFVHQGWRCCQPMTRWHFFA